jgi:hypothetical protein
MDVEDVVRKPILRRSFDEYADLLLAFYNVSKGLRVNVNKGINREIFCQQFLSRVLPPRLKVSLGGEIWDSKGRNTGQLDVIVVRDDCPRLYFGGADAYLVEGVFGVVEVVSDLQVEKLETEIERLRLVKGLYAPPPSAMMGVSQIRWTPLCVVFAYEGAQWDTLKNVLDKPDNSESVDFVCILNRGVWISDPSLLCRSRVGEKPLLSEDKAKAPLVRLGKAASLSFLWYYLVKYSTGLVARSMDIDRYLEPLEGWSDTEESPSIS